MCRRCERLNLRCEHVECDDRFRHYSQKSPRNSSSRLQQRYPIFIPQCEPILLPTIDTSVEDCAKNAFLSNYVLHPCNHGYTPGYLEALPLVLAGRKSSKALELSVCASSLAFLAATRDEKKLQARAHCSYAKALEALGTEIRSGSTSDATLMSMLVLDFFDILLGYEDGPVGPHSQALAAVLVMRGAAQLPAAVGNGLFRVAFQRLLIRCASAGADDHLDQLSSLTYHIRPSFHGRVARFNLRTIDLRRQICAILDLGAVECDIVDLLGKVDALTSATAKLHTDCDFQKRPRPFNRLPTAPKPRNGVVGEQVVLYHDLWLANEWILHGAFRLDLMEKLAELLGMLVSSGVEAAGTNLIARLADAELAVRKRADEIIKSVPMLSGTVTETGVSFATPQGKTIGAFFSRYPLQVVTKARSATKDQVLRSKILLKTMENRMRGRRLWDDEVAALLVDLEALHS